MTSDLNENPQPENEPSNDSSEFAEMLEAEGSTEIAPPQVGDQLTGKIVQIGEQDAFVDCGLRNELPIDTEELRDKEGQLKFQEGDELTAYVQKGPSGLKLTLALKLDSSGHEVLTKAFEAGTPVEGKVKDTNKGGFSVLLGDLRAFCPFSQIDSRRVEDPSQFVGKTFEFKILELSDDGRNIVVSRRALLQAGREEMAKATRSSLQTGDVIEGVITRLVPFGAFVDIGGIEGLIHISQISHQRIAEPADVLNEGQSVKVKVLEIQNLGMGRSERISLSLKALASDPWPSSASGLVPGTDVTGRITRLVDFGVFVELLPGVEGLIHISELANRRIVHPREVVNEEESVSVRILDVDLDRRRISLSLRQSAEYEGE